MARFTEETMEHFDETIEASQKRSYAIRDAARKERRDKAIRRRQRALVYVASYAASAGIFFGGPKAVDYGLDSIKDAFKTDNAHELAMEACVGKLVGREVDLVQNPLGGGLQHPASVIAQQRACERNDGDPALAQYDIRPVPLASAGN